MKNSGKGGHPSSSFVAGSVALLFLVIGYQAALFIHKASVARIVANHDHPDTVYVIQDDSVAFDGAASGLRPYSAAAKRGWTRPGPDGRPSTTPAGRGVRKEYEHSEAAESIRRANTPRRYESFRFDPNTATIDDLMRLGFTLRQAQSIDNYRKKGGRFRRKSDFARSYVVEDSVYQRLEKYISIPKIDINSADSAAFETLPGIGKFFASRMVSYRLELHGYSYPEQLMDIWHFDQEKYDGLKDLITVGPSEPYPLWTLPENELALHPYIGKRAAHAIIIFRENTPKEEWSAVALLKAGILDKEKGEKLARCRISPP
ncbi:MAG: helix-hairpin-helix domain-containing protein [Bacteroidales bacterium]|nr:helix-hairpin-helix domain-containing protein [Bacteroidales bacterium]